MKLYVVAIRDRAADVFGQPSFVAALGQATRSFADEINRAAENNIFYAHPEDFDLYHIGMYDDSDGSLLPDVPRMISVGKDCRPKSN